MIRQCLTGDGEEVGGKLLVNMEKTQRYNADQTGLKGKHEDRARRGLKSPARGGISLGQE